MLHEFYVLCGNYEIYCCSTQQKLWVRYDEDSTRMHFHVINASRRFKDRVVPHQTLQASQSIVKLGAQSTLLSKVLIKFSHTTVSSQLETFGLRCRSSAIYDDSQGITSLCFYPFLVAKITRSIHIFL
jgi:hypothetical protein